MLRIAEYLQNRREPICSAGGIAQAFFQAPCYKFRIVRLQARQNDSKSIGAKAIEGIFAAQPIADGFHCVALHQSQLRDIRATDGWSQFDDEDAKRACEICGTPVFHHQTILELIETGESG